MLLNKSKFELPCKHASVVTFVQVCLLVSLNGLNPGVHIMTKSEVVLPVLLGDRPFCDDNLWAG